MKGFLSIILILLFIQALPGQDKTKTNIAVIDLESRGGLSQSEIGSLTDRLRSLLVRTNTFNVVDRGKMEEILAEQGFQMTGCTSAECVVEAGQILGVEQMISGSIGKIGRLYTVDIILIEVGTSQIIKSITRDYRGEIEGLVELMGSITNELSGLSKSGPDSGSTGGINATTDPAGAGLSIDGELKGETPLNLSALTPGRHQVKIALKGYAPYEEEVTVSAGKVYPLHVVLQKAFDISITSTPSQAEVYVNSRKVGVTPFSGSGVPNAKLDIELRKENYTLWQQTLVLTRNTDLDVKLEMTQAYKNYLASQLNNDIKKEEGSNFWWWLGGGAVLAGTAAYFILTGEDSGKNSTYETFPEPPGRP